MLQNSSQGALEPACCNKPDKQACIQPGLSVKAAEKCFSIRDARDVSLVRWKQITFVSLHLGEQQKKFLGSH
jgi:hypothetical protein